jgi:hypothetical protein
MVCLDAQASRLETVRDELIKGPWMESVGDEGQNVVDMVLKCAHVTELVKRPQRKATNPSYSSHSWDSQTGMV